MNTHWSRKNTAGISRFLLTTPATRNNFPHKGHRISQPIPRYKFLPGPLNDRPELQEHRADRTDHRPKLGGHHGAGGRGDPCPNRGGDHVHVLLYCVLLPLQRREPRRQEPQELLLRRRHRLATSTAAATTTATATATATVTVLATATSLATGTEQYHRLFLLRRNRVWVILLMMLLSQ